MGQVLDRFIRDAHILGPSVERDLRDAMEIGREEWIPRVSAMRHAGVLQASATRWIEPLMPMMTADQTAVAGTAEAILCAADYSGIPAKYFDAPGKKARVRGFGVMTTGVTPGTLILTPRFGTTTGGTSLAAGAVSGTLAASQTAVPWCFDAECACSIEGTGGQVAFFGIWESPRGYTAAPGVVEVGSGARTTVDTTVAAGLVVTATLSQAGSSMTMRAFSIESYN